MRRALTVAAAWLALGAASASAQDWVARVFPERAFDFGTVARGSKLRHTFRLVNSTNQPIHVADWRTKCGCTEVRVGARDIPPGTQTTVEATIDTSKFQGYKASGLVLVLDRPLYTEIDLNLTCFIRSDVLVNPGQVDFGVVARKTKPILSLTLTYLGAQPDWAVTKMQTQSALVSAQLRELEHPAGSPAQYQLTATLDPAAPSGYFKDEIALLTNDPSSPRIPISVSANIQSTVTVSPTILNLGRVRAGQSIKKTVMVRSSNHQAFRLKAVQGSSSDLTAASIADEPREMHVVTVTFKAPTQAGPFNGTLEIATDLQDEPPSKVTAFATIVP